VEFVRELFFH
ncbi:hypothetical protein CPC698_0996B, partial [Chlamydia psittaci C6/98]